MVRYANICFSFSLYSFFLFHLQVERTVKFQWTLRTSCQAFRGDFMENPMRSDSQGYCRVCHDVGPKGERCLTCWHQIELERDGRGLVLLNWFQKKYHAVFVDAGFKNSVLKYTELPCNEELRKTGECVQFMFVSK